MLDWRLSRFRADVLQLYQADRPTMVYRNWISAQCEVHVEDAGLRRAPFPHPTAAALGESQAKGLASAFPVQVFVRPYAGPRFHEREGAFDWTGNLVPPTGEGYGLKHKLLGQVREATLRMVVGDSDVVVWHRDFSNGSLGAGLFASTRGLTMSWMTQRVEDLGGREKRSIARGLEIADDGITGVFERRLERKLQGVLDRRKDSKIEAQHPGYQAACELEQQINQAVASDAIAATFELDGCAVVNANISEPSPSTTRIVQIAIGNAWGKQVIFPFICEIDRFDQSLSSVADAIGIYSAVVKSRMINQSQPQAAEALKSRLDLAASTESGRFLSEDGTINVGVEGRMLEPSLDWQAMQS